MKVARKKRILIYYPPNKRAVGLNAVVDLLLTLDVEIFLLTQEPPGILHNEIEKKLPASHCFGLNLSVGGGLSFYYKHAKALVNFCKCHKIDIIFSHLQTANLVSLIAQPFLPSTKLISFRHHFHYFKKFNVGYLKVGRNDLLGEKIVSSFAKKIVVPSTTVREGMVQYENVNPSKIQLIPYVYNFDEYPKIVQENVDKIRSDYSAQLLLLMCSRFVEAKRHRLVITVLTNLIKNKGLDIKVLLLDDGPLRAEIQALVESLGLRDHFIFVGFTTNVLDYMAAADLLVHPSLAEASNSSVKEMALAGKTAVVCRGVGDFDDYIDHYRNGFLINPINSEKELDEVLQFAYTHSATLQEMGISLRKEVLAKFSPGKEVLDLYKLLLN